MTLLPDDTRPRPPQPANTVRRRRGFYVLMWLLLLVLALTLTSLVVILVYEPTIVGLERGSDLTQTQAMIQQTAVALDAVGVALESTAASNAQQNFDNRSTAAALQNQIALFEQGETQSAQNAAGTATGVALANAQQATQSALDFQGTQTAFERQATQVELDYQGTQAALNQNATAVALGFATDASPALEEFAPTPSPDPLFNEGFTTGLDAGLWTYSDISDWSLDVDGGLIAVDQRAWLLTQRDDFQTYTAETVLVPVPGAMNAYYLLLNTTIDSGLAVEVFYDGSAVTAVGLYRVSRTQIENASLLTNQNITALQTLQTSLAPAETITIQAQVRADRVTVFVDGTATLDLPSNAPPPAGAIGVYVPNGTDVRRISVEQ